MLLWELIEAMDVTAQTTIDAGERGDGRKKGGGERRGEGKEGAGKGDRGWEKVERGELDERGKRRGG